MTMNIQVNIDINIGDIIEITNWSFNNGELYCYDYNGSRYSIVKLPITCVYSGLYGCDDHKFTMANGNTIIIAFDLIVKYLSYVKISQ